MAKKIQKFIEVAVSDLERSLETLKNKVGESEQVHTSFSNHNMVVLSSYARDEASDQALIDHLIRVNPARFFLVVFAKVHPHGTYKISAKCELVSKEEKICSEIVKIECASESVVEVASVLRGHLLAGVSSDVFITDLDSLNENIAKHILTIADRVIYDGKDLKGLSKVSWIGKFCSNRIDIEWLRLSSWREAIRMLFEVPVIGNQVSRIKEVEVSCNFIKNEGQVLPLSALHLAAWILGCLELEVSALGVDFYECRNSEGSVVKLRFKDQDSNQGVSGVNIRFQDADRSNISNLNLSSSADKIICQMSGNSEFRTECLLKEHTSLELLERFFLVGTSVNQYDAALRLSIDIENLQKGYKFHH